MSEILKVVKAGQKLGYKGEKLQDWVNSQLASLREERAEERRLQENTACNEELMFLKEEITKVKQLLCNFQRTLEDNEVALESQAQTERREGSDYDVPVHYDEDNDEREANDEEDDNRNKDNDGGDENSDDNDDGNDNGDENCEEDYGDDEDNEEDDDDDNADDDKGNKHQEAAVPERTHEEQSRDEKSSEESTSDKTTRESKQVHVANVSIRIFDEKNDKFDTYIMHFETVAKLLKWPQDEWAFNLSCLVRGNMLEAIYGLPSDERNDYKCVKAALMRLFETSEHDLREEFFTTDVRPAETPALFMARLERTLDRWMLASGIENSFEELRNLLLREAFYRRCSPELTSYLREKGVTTRYTMMERAQRYLDAYTVTLDGMKRLEESIGVSGKSNNTSHMTKNENDHGATCSICTKSGHEKDECWFRTQDSNVKSCFRCHGTDHLVNKCKQPRYM